MKSFSPISFRGKQIMAWIVVSIGFFATTFALPLGAVCETQNCDAGLICKNSNGQNVPPGSGPGTCVVNCNNNNNCDSGETTQYCPNDCRCGNGTCETNSPWNENSTNCPNDCYCGNGSVEAGETNCTCSSDVPQTTCGDGCCKPGETPSNCSQDCGTCGNGTCDSGETSTNCPADCNLCGNGTCNSGESACSCPSDCSPTCGDDCCNGGETVSSCYGDCGQCGDNICTAPNETINNCPSDCHVCGDSVCTAPWENANNCVDCQTPSCTISGPEVCRNNSYTFDCNHYYANGPFTMTNSNPNQSSQTDSISVSFGPTAQGVTSLKCFNNGTQLCSTTRAIGYCGDGAANCGEQCDYGNSFPNACDPVSCTREPCTQSSDCGGPFVCTDGYCTPPVCGDGVVSPGEQCETNAECPSGYTCDGCFCTPPGGGGGGICGNGWVELGEQCDDGDPAHPGQGGTIIEMDQCNGATCTLANVCGDGIVGPGEQCDNGGKCTKYPASSYPPLPNDPYCNEESDCNYASNAVCAPRGGDGCSATCQNEPGRVCGDGITMTGNNEQCDDANTTNGDGCDNNCTFSACGNGIVAGTEECDDGNTNPADGCSYPNCQGAFCGDGILQEKGANGVTGGGDDEVCDDGNEVNGDGCTADCSYCGLHCPDCSVKRPNLDIFFVVDTSDSMLEGSDNNFTCADGICKLIDAKTAVEMFVNALNPAEDRVALIEFNTNATVKYPLAANTGFSQMITAVNNLQATGLTNMGDAMSVLTTLANNYTYTGRTPVVIFLGDGQPTRPLPDPVQHTKTQALAFHAAFPSFKTYAIGFDLVSLSPTNQATAIDLLQNYIASTPADFYQGAPGGRGSVCGGGKGSDRGLVFGGGGGIDSVIGGTLGLSETYGQIWGQMCQCGFSPPPASTCSDTVKEGGTSIGGTIKSGFCAGSTKVACANNAACGLAGPCITSNNLCGGWEWYECSGTKRECSGCGDGIVGTGEQCDFGSGANGQTGVGCDAFCKLTTYCGDGVVQSCEVCDDGNYIEGDGCSPRCTKEATTCGDGVLNLCGALTGTYILTGNDFGYCAGDPTVTCNAKGMSCPSGQGPCLEATYCNLGIQGTCLNNPAVVCTSNFDCTDNKGASSVCVGLALAQIPDPSAGGPLDLKQICGGGQEACDDGNTTGGDSCPADCLAICGNGLVEGNEACDDGNNVNTDSCTSTCAIARCGDSIVRPGIEQCDDGKNGDNADGCTDTCTFGECDPTTTYASGVIPGWVCPEDWVLQGCPGAYICVRKTIAPIICTECGNGTKDTTEECDWSDLTDPHREACNQYCLLNYCGDGVIFTGAYTGVVWTWNASGASLFRPALEFSRVITQGQGGMNNYILDSGAGSGSSMGKSMSVSNLIKNNLFDELLVALPGHRVGNQPDHGQMLALSFDTGGKVNGIRPYFSGTLLGGAFKPIFLETIANTNNAGGYDSIIFPWGEALLGMFGGADYLGTNTGSIAITPIAQSSIVDTVQVGDIDNNGIDDVALAYLDNGVVHIAVILVTGNPVARLSMQTITTLGIAGTDQVKLSKIGDSDSDGVEDLMISNYNDATGTLAIKRVLLQATGALKSQTTVWSSAIGKSSFAFAIYGPDIDEDGIQDIMTVRAKETPYLLNGTILFMNANWTVRTTTLVDLGAAKAPGDTGYFPHEAIFLPDFDTDNDETLAIGSPKSFNYWGAIYTYELQAPYGHEVTGGTSVEECDPGSFCPDGTECTDNPSLCPGSCLPGYTNGCTPFCQWGCGNGDLDPDGIDNDIMTTGDNELCDDGNDVNDDACTNTCQRPVCGDGILTMNSGWTGNNGSWLNYDEMCDPAMTGGTNCPNSCILTGGVYGKCNYQFASASGYNIETFPELQATAIALGTRLCNPSGSVTQPGAHIMHSGPVGTGVQEWKWTCLGLAGGGDSSCSLPRWSCGDGIVDAWPGIPTPEQCDDGNRIGGDGCSATCSWEKPLLTTSGQCTVTSYPQIEQGEYLPIWWKGTWNESVGPVGMTCADAAENIVLRDGIMCTIKVRRGAPGGGTTEVSTVTVPCSSLATQGQGLISGAIQDFAPGVSMSDIVGTYLFNPTEVTTWITAGGTPVYGQYQMRVSDMTMQYCALRRTDNAGTVTGTVTTTGAFEDCTNNFDDNGDGYVDCADSAQCNPASHPHCNINVPPPPPLPENTVLACTDNIDNDQDGQKDCADSECVSFAHCQSTVRPENCKSTADEDGDGLGGCDDPNCAAVPYCIAFQPNSPESSFSTCTDQVDNDADGLYDCNDPNCLITVPECVTSVNECIDSNNNEKIYLSGAWQFNDGSQGIDLIFGSAVKDENDPQCFLGGGAYYIVEQNCYDSTSDNNISQVDCTDPTCQFFSVCGTSPFNAHYTDPNRSIQPPSEVCTDGMDNDGDGWIDCADWNCKTDPACTNVPPPPPGGTGENCSVEGDEDGDTYEGCTDGECKTEPVCLPGPAGRNEHCFNVDAAGYPLDDDGDYLANQEDPDCFYYWGAGHVPPEPIGGRVSSSTMYMSTTGAVCDAGFAVSKGYFVQQGFALTEQANSGLDTANFTSIEGVSLVAEGTAIDESLNTVATYQGAGKSYLFDDFITTWETKAVNPIYPRGTINAAIKFLKVPSSHIYFWAGQGNTVTMTQDDIDDLLTAGGVTAMNLATTSFTIVLPEQGQKLIIAGSVAGNGMYISKGNIKFASSTEQGCDGSDSVEGLFVAGGSFETDTIGNDDLSQDEWCKGGNLEIKGTLLGLNAGSSLAPQRRSVLNAWNTNAYLFNDSKVYQAKELFENCYLPALLHKKAFAIHSAFLDLSGPIAGCSADTLWGANRESVKSYVKTKGDAFLNELPFRILTPSFSCTTTCGTHQSKIDYILPMMDQGFNGTGTLLVPQAITIIKPNGSTTTISVQQNSELNGTLLYQMQQQNKLFPLRWFQGGRYNTTTKVVTINLTKQEDRKEMIEDLGRIFQPLKEQFLSFPAKDNQAKIADNLPGSATVNYTNMTTLVGKLYSIWGAGLSTAIDALPVPGTSCPSVELKAGGTVKGGGFNKFICQPDMIWLRTNRTQYLAESDSRTENIIDGSSIVISSQPKIRTDLPPGAKAFLNSLTVLPQ